MVEISSQDEKKMEREEWPLIRLPPSHSNSLSLITSLSHSESLTLPHSLPLPTWHIMTIHKLLLKLRPFLSYLHDAKIFLTFNFSFFSYLSLFLSLFCGKMQKKNPQDSKQPIWMQILDHHHRTWCQMMRMVMTCWPEWVRVIGPIVPLT